MTKILLKVTSVICALAMIISLAPASFAADSSVVPESEIVSVKEESVNAEDDVEDAAFKGQDTDSEEKIDINKATIVLAQTVVKYTGSAQAPAETVIYDGNTLVKGQDYIVSYEDNINVGTAKVVCVGMGKYAGSQTVSFTIIKADQVLKASPTSVSLKYGGTETISVTGNKGAITFKSANTSVATVDSYGKVTAKKNGSTTITITAAATDNYNAASITVPVSVNGISLKGSNTKITLSKTTYTYNGKKKKPTPTVKYKGKKLKKGKDYKVTYEDNIDAGKGKVIITGINKYCDQRTKKFKIKKATNTMTATISATQVDLKKKIKITVKKAIGTVTFTSSNKSIATVSKTGVIYGKKTGKVTITVQAAGDDNYKALKKTFSVYVGIKSLSDSKCKMYLSQTTYTYDGNYKYPTVSVYFDGTKLSLNTDYTVKYYNNKNVGTAKVVVTGRGNYSGSRTLKFYIKGSGQNFTISLPNNRIPLGGRAKVTVSGKYYGTLTFSSYSPSYAKPDGNQGWYKGLRRTKNYVTICVTASGDSSHAAESRTLRVQIN